MIAAGKRTREFGLRLPVAAAAWLLLPLSSLAQVSSAVAPRPMTGILAGSPFRQAGIQGGDLAGQQFLVHLSPGQEVSQADLLALFGAEVVTSQQGEMSIRFSPPVRAWLARWRLARELAERKTRLYSEQRSRDSLETGLAKLTDQPPIDEEGNPILPRGVQELNGGRFMKALPAPDRERIYAAIAATSPVRRGGRFSATESPLIYRFVDLPEAAKAALQEAVTDNPLTAEQLQDLTVECLTPYPETGGSVTVLATGPGERGISLNGGGGTLDPGRAERFLRNRLLERLAAGSTPAQAMLGARPGADGNWLSPVRLEDPRLGERAVPIRTNEQGWPDAVSRIASHLGLSLVADYHTDTRPMPSLLGARTSRAQLEAIAKAYDLVIRQRGNLLCVRHQFWPDADEEEPPASRLLRWVELTSRRQAFTLRDCLEIAALTQPQRDTLYAYRTSAADLRSIIAGCELSRWALETYRGSSPAVRRQICSSAGWRMSNAGLKQLPLYRAFVRTSGLKLRRTLETSPLQQLVLKFEFWQGHAPDESGGLLGVVLSSTSGAFVWGQSVSSEP